MIITLVGMFSAPDCWRAAPPDEAERSYQRPIQ
jgi:hypothetical protein